MHNLAAILSLVPSGGSSGGVTDSFNRADNASSLGTADTGQTWTALASTWGISSNQAYNPGAGANAPAVLDSGKSDCTIQVTIATQAGDSGLSFRATDANNFFEVTFSTTQYQVWKIVAGAFTNLASGTITGANGDVLKVVLSGSTIQIFQNGVQLGTNITDAFNQTATKHGLSQVSGSAGARWDNFSVA